MIQTLTDKFAIGLSLLCAAHCLAFPLAMIWLPSLAALQLDGESFNLWMLLAVIPTSVYALPMGCMKHKRFQLLVLGFIGLALMISAVLFEESVGESGEKWLTVIGATFMAVGHFLNYRLCRSHQGACDCPEHQSKA